MTPEQQKALREPFPKEQIGKLPKGGTSLDYVGHAAVTDRLLAVDPEWTWEPVAFGPDGSPLITTTGKEVTLWIRLTVGGVTRLGVGSCAPGAGELAKQLVSDAIRNAAMRFGVALDLWSKEDLLVEEQPPPDTGGYETVARWKEQIGLLRGDIKAAKREADFVNPNLYPWPWRRETIEEIREALRHPRGEES